ncbi:MAG: hypothetical protein ACR2OC_06065 [Solirubrobacterales bacterium]
MSWQVSTFALLALLLVGGFVWYERSRPSARLIGLVAALAALAAAGRVALTPIPNVTPTTDIALLSGYSLGGPAGFVIGALAALVSNFWLGQGPWTPWQIAAWGLAGLAGAAIARATGRRLGRFGLALACAIAGLLYGALLDLSVMVTYGGEQSLDRYLALSARGIPFNIAHAVGNFVFALAAGPAFVAILTRFRSRLEFDWEEPPPRPRRALGAGVAGLLAAIVVIVAASPGGGGGAVAAASDSSRVQLASGPVGARRYLERAQNRDGGLPATPGGESSVAISGWAMLGLEASGRNPLDLRNRGRNPVDFLRSTASSIKSTGDLERTILALDAAGVSPRAFAGRDLVAELNGRRAGNGSFHGQVNLTAFGILALRAAGTPRSSLRRPAEWLRRAANRDGGWGFQPQSPSESDSTGAAIQGLASVGNRGSAVSRGAGYLRRSQRGDGGWSLAFGGPTNAQSTAWAVQGLIAAGADPNVSKGTNTPFDYLAARQSPDGHYRYSASADQTPVWVTGQALTAVERAPFPLARVPRSTEPGGVALPSPASSGGGDGKAAGGGGGGEPGGRNGKDERPADKANGSDPKGGSASSDSPAALAGETVVPGVSGAETVETPSEEGGLETPVFLAAGFALLALGLGTGFLIYRRRLP